MKALALAALFAAGVARADQCEVVTPAQAQAALKLLKVGVKVVELCEPCGDERPGAPLVVARVELAAWSQPPLQTVSVNGKGEDLAYLFVQKALGDSHYLNLAVLTKCAVEGVSREIDLAKYKAAAGPVQQTP